MEIAAQIIDFLPLVGLIYVTFRAVSTDDNVEAIKFLLWGVLFQLVPIVDYVLNV
jgi:hypothetical protein